MDFIDRESAKTQREVENRLKDALKYARARVQLGKISRFGLMELSRQRLRPALAESAYIPCPRCHGIGHIRGTESTALHILRILQEEAMKENTAQVVAQVPVDVATFLLNEKRPEIHGIETVPARVSAPPRREPPREPREDRGRGRRDRPERREQREQRDGRGQDRSDARRDAQRGESREQPKQRPPQGGQQQPRRERESGRDGQREAQKQRPPREPRPAQEQRPADPAQAAITQGQPGATHDAEHGEGARRRRDRRRGGRDPGERNVHGEPRGDRGGQRPAAPQPAAPTHEVAPATRAEAIREVEALPPALRHDDHLHETPAPAMPAVLEPAPDSEIVRVEAAAVPPAQAVKPAEPAAMPRNAPEIPRVALELPPDSGLVLVETTHAASTTAEEIEPSRAHRQRPPRVTIAEEPLQMVETTHKDSTPAA